MESTDALEAPLFDEDELLEVGRAAFAFDAAGWELMFDNRGFKAWRKQRENSGLYVYKVLGTVESTPQVYFDFYQDIEYWHVWDDHLEKLEKFGEDESGNVVHIYWAVRYPFPFSNRDYVFKRFAKYYSEDSLWIIRNKSFIDPSRPPSRSRVRVENFQTTVILRAGKDGSTEIFLESFSDAKMMLPQSLINLITAKLLPAFLDRLKETVRKYPEYLAKKAETNVNGKKK